ncbi:zinc/iron permease [Phanerochaete sordida]|uniref:Zinc/iron permease n=1 Tax=Phanerochaete sordida TaxID=48140 RepID=A0A9P3LAT7_9APHY|nr:zinc/iron permease [Phanerochaete sordida]
MSGLVGLLTMAAVLGVGSFAIGMLPLAFTFSRLSIARLSSVGTGLLLGTALGVIIPEGVETISFVNSSSHFPTTTIALSLVGGFTIMLILERVIHKYSPDAHGHMPLPSADRNENVARAFSRVEFDVELGELEREEGAEETLHQAPEEPADTSKAWPLTLGLMVHALADGFALGASATSPVDRGMSITVFLALLVHKAPAVLALTTSLMTTSLPRADCRKHLALFSASTPVGALFVYGLLSVIRVNSESPWTGVCMLVSGGTFLYVATVLQPGKAASEELDEKIRTAFVICGMFVPVLIGAVVGHDH